MDIEKPNLTTNQLLNILIIEDEALVAAALIKLLQELIPNAQIHGPLARIREINLWFQENELPDLILADIQLSDGLSFTALEKIPSISPIIFTTAFDAFALKAFRLNSIDYLLKPIELADLQRAINKWSFIHSKFQDAAFVNQMRNFLAGNKQEVKYKQRLLVHQGKGMIPLAIIDLALIEKVEDLILAVNKEGVQYITDFRSIDEIQEMLDPKICFRANRQNLIFLGSLTRFETHVSGKIAAYIIHQNQEIGVSKEKAAAFKDWVGR